MNDRLSTETIALALSHIAPDDRDTWVTMAMAVKSELGEAGFDIWDQWSSGAASYNQKSAKEVWRSVSAGGKTGIGTLIKMASDHGFSLKDQKQISDEELNRRQKSREADIRKEEKRRAERQAKAAKDAQHILDAASPSAEHPYLARKSITTPGDVRVGDYPRWTPDGTIVIQNALLIPIRHNGRLVSLQAIFPDDQNPLGRDRDYLPGGLKQGGYFPLGKITPDTDTLLITEGYATGCAVHAATGWPVLVAFDAGNLTDVATAARQKLPEAAIVICADNDQWTDGNPGVKQAVRAAESAAAIVAIPRFDDTTGHPTDFDDLSRIAGPSTVLHQIQSAINPPPDDYSDVPPPEADDFPAEYLEPRRDEPFRILGYNRSTCYYLPDGFRQVVALPTRDHSKLRLLELAPLSFWKSHYIDDSKRSGDRTDWHLAAESLIRRAQRAGIWDDDMIRGRGAWWDNGLAAVHLGDRVVVDGREYELGDTPGRFVYELNTGIDIATDDPLQNSEAMKLTEICEALRWQRPISGKLLAGWVFLAPICGALDWRPHIWITGGAGSGKSTIMTQIIHRTLKSLMLFVQGETTEAGLRQELGHDAIPVVFDEIESQDDKATNRVNSIMDLMTIASSETGAKLVKGGANGKAQSFMIRSMFCFSSISVNLKQHAAKTRVTVLDMRPKPEHETERDLAQYNGMLETIYTVLTPDYIRRLQARAVSLIPTIRHNSRVFAEAAALSVGSRRFGDQIGTLLAGAYALQNRGEVTPAAARAFVDAQQWDDHHEGEESKDERACVQHILGEQVTVDTQRGPKRRAIGELVDLCVSGIDDEDDGVTVSAANATLRRCGLAVADGEDPLEGNRLVVATNHKVLSKILAGSPWAASWARTLLRIKGATKTEPKKFAGVTSRGVSIPIDKI